MEENTALVEISKAQQALERANDIHEIMDLRDKAMAYQLFANAQGFKEAAQEAKIYQLKAERKAGDWLMENVKPGNPQLLQDATIDTRLPDGVDKYESHRWQLEASVPDPVFNQWIDESLANGKEISAAGLQQVGRELRRIEQIEQARTTEPPAGKYQIIYADPPWQYQFGFDIHGAALRHYNTMSIEELCKLPVRDLSDDNAVLFLWVTSPKLNECFKVIEAWGFEYKTSFVWDKVKHVMGHYNSVRHELLLICVRGSYPKQSNTLIDSVVTIERSDEHSEKPERFREIIDEMYPYGKRIELFARRKVEGWDTWGDQV